MLNVYLAPPANLSRAMFRVSAALERHAPSGVRIVTREADADLVVLHVIGSEATKLRPSKPYAVIQYCYATAGGTVDEWRGLWSRAELVWSYYDLTHELGPNTNFLCAPLGIDPAFLDRSPEQPRGRTIVTTGYVTGPTAEAIDEVVRAALVTRNTVRHIGPLPVGMDQPSAGWTAFQNISDCQLARIYGSASWVSGLRHVEGFELPVIEGLACGARPVVFDRPDMRRWYDGHAVFVPESFGDDLTEHLVRVFEHPPEPLSESEHAIVRAKFAWSTTARYFWGQLLTKE